MNIYEISGDSGLKPSASPSFPTSGAVDGTMRWVRMTNPQLHEWKDALRNLDFPEAASKILHQTELTSQVKTFGERLIISLPVVDRKGERAVRLRAVWTPPTLITFEEMPLPAIDHLVAERSISGSSELSLSGLLIEIIDAAVGSAGATYLSLRRELEDLADSVESDPQGASPEDLLAIRSKVARLTMLWDDQIHGFMELKRCHSIITVGDHAHKLLGDLISDTSRGLQLLAHMENRLRDLRQHQQQSSQESTNRRLNMLAILSSIYMPATLIAGLYGMNFEYIPVTSLRYGYFIVMGVMGVIVLGHFWYFYRRGWFK